MRPALSSSISIATRRRFLACVAAAVATAPLTRLQGESPATQEKNNLNQTRTSIHYEIDFHPSPQRLYAAILDQKQFAAFSGLPATIDPTPGGAFSQFGGLIVGRNIELLPDLSPNPRIVQAWRPSRWPAGIYSIVHFEFKPRGPETSLIFDHIAFPAGEYDSLDQGWHTHYWEPLKKFFV